MTIPNPNRSPNRKPVVGSHSPAVPWIVCSIELRYATDPMLFNTISGYVGLSTAMEVAPSCGHLFLGESPNHRGGFGGTGFMDKPMSNIRVSSFYCSLIIKPRDSKISTMGFGEIHFRVSCRGKSKHKNFKTQKTLIRREYLSGIFTTHCSTDVITHNQAGPPTGAFRWTRAPQCVSLKLEWTRCQQTWVKKGNCPKWTPFKCAKGRDGAPKRKIYENLP